MSNSTPTLPPTTSPTPTSSPSSLSLASLSWAFGGISDATTCTNVSINWQIFNTPSDLSAILTSTSIVDFAITIIGLGSSNVLVPLKTQGSAEQVLGGSMRLEWFANVPAGFYDVTGVATGDVEQGSSIFDNTSPAIETAFTVHQGADTPCIPSDFGSSSSSSSDFQTMAPAQPHSHSSSNTGAIAGGVVGGTLALALLTAGLFLFLKRRQQHRHCRRDSLSGDGDAHNGRGWNGLTLVGSIHSPSTVLARDGALVSSNRGRAMGTVSTIMPNSSDSRQDRNSSSTQNHGTICATETSTEALFNSYAITPFQTPSHPVADFEEEKLSTHDDPRPLPLAVPNDSHLLNDGANSSLNQRIRPLPNPFVPVSQPADSGSTHPVADVLETSTAPFSRLSFTASPEEMHADSGVRLARDTLMYDETSSEWSLRSKDKLPPPYSHN